MPRKRRRFVRKNQILDQHPPGATRHASSAEGTTASKCRSPTRSNPLTAKTRFLDVDFAAQMEEDLVVNRCRLSQVGQFRALRVQ
jgi:hypothetical protein